MIEQADVISIELHGTKENVDRMLLPSLFGFKSAARRRACEKFVSSMLAHPRAGLEVLLFTLTVYPKIIRMRRTIFVIMTA